MAEAEMALAEVAEAEAEAEKSPRHSYITGFFFCHCAVTCWLIVLQRTGLVNGINLNYEETVHLYQFESTSCLFIFFILFSFFFQKKRLPCSASDVIKCEHCSIWMYSQQGILCSRNSIHYNTEFTIKFSTLFARWNIVPIKTRIYFFYQLIYHFLQWGTTVPSEKSHSCQI